MTSESGSDSPGVRFAEMPVWLRRPLIVAGHVLLVGLVYRAAFVLRFDLPVPSRYVTLFWGTLPVLLVIRLGVFAYFRLFQGFWRHAGIQDLRDLFKAVTLSTMLFLAAMFLLGNQRDLPRSLLVLDWLVAMAVFGGLRFAVRTAREERIGWQRVRHGKRALIIGAGDAAESLLRQFRRHESERIRPVVLVDDDPRKHGRSLHGITVAGSTADIGALVLKHRIEILVLAIPSATASQVRQIVERCVETGLEFKIVPPLDELVDGLSRLTQLRTVNVEDLLGRSAVRLELDPVQRDLREGVVLVTGGAGSIGAELARQIVHFGPRRLVLVDRAESPLYYIDHELRSAHPDLELVPIVADVANEPRLEHVFARHRPTHVFHAAAYKHVPLMEDNAVEAVRNNVVGTYTLAMCAVRHRVQTFVLISTDKAVRPSSVMGASKRIAERIVLGWPALRAAGTDFRAVRFGNVLGSDGSVVPLFRRQLAAGRPLTVTHPEVTRYFMTIPEAAQLVLQASVLPDAAGRICMLEMGDPVRILTLAENLIRLSGLEPHRDVPIVFTGLRPGEKLHEELSSDVEETVATSVEKIRVVQTEEADPHSLRAGIDRLTVALTLGNREDLLAAIRVLVPDCVAPLRVGGWRTPELRPLSLGPDGAPRRRSRVHAGALAGTAI